MELNGFNKTYTYLIKPKDELLQLPYGLKEIPVKVLSILPTGQMQVKVQPFMYNIRLEDWDILGFVGDRVFEES